MAPKIDIPCASRGISRSIPVMVTFTIGAGVAPWPRLTRSASARILNLTVVDDARMSAAEAAQLVASLGSTYGVPVSWAYDPKLRRTATHVNAATRSLEPVRADPV
ncbi:MAG TPA: hypothetical protein VFR27_03115 [Mycobacterium sp.]|nr:hypothetical protein [Mycobacterium sp.]